MFSDLSLYILAPLWYLPYAIFFLLHVASWLGCLHPTSASQRFIARAVQASPTWVQLAISWCGPNIGLVLHLHRLVVMYILALGCLPPNAAILSIQKNIRQAKYIGIVYKIGVMAVESYDLRAVVLVACLLDGPMWLLLWRSLKVPRALQYVVMTELVTIFSQALLAYCRMRRRHLMSSQPVESIVKGGCHVEAPPSGSIGVVPLVAPLLAVAPNKKAD